MYKLDNINFLSNNTIFFLKSVSSQLNYRMIRDLQATAARRRRTTRPTRARTWTSARRAGRARGRGGARPACASTRTAGSCATATPATSPATTAAPASVGTQHVSSTSVEHVVRHAHRDICLQTGARGSATARWWRASACRSRGRARPPARPRRPRSSPSTIHLVISHVLFYYVGITKDEKKRSQYRSGTCDYKHENRSAISMIL